MKVNRRIRQFVRVRVSARLRARYARALEDEVTRLRAENRALINSIHTIAGLPAEAGIPPTRGAALAESGGSGRRLQVGFGPAGVDSDANAGGPEGRPYAPEARAGASAIEPKRSVRRRSWPQIGRALALEDARAAQRERESNARTFPAPRNIVRRNS